MLKLSLVLAAVLSLQVSPSASESGARFGFARMVDDVACVAISGSHLKVGASVVVVSGDDRGRQGQVLRLLKSCEAFERADVPGPYYAIKFSSPLQHGVAVVATGQTPRHAVTKCASSEGLHFNAWAGTPRKSARIWHGYWYAGYDLKRNCTKSEVGDVAPN